MKTALITGGARGIGAAMVRLFCEKGYRVCFSYFESSQAAQALSLETGAVAIRADLRQGEEAISLLKQAVACLSHLDVLICNAGMAWSGLSQQMSLEDYDALMALNLRAPFLCAREAIPIMLRRQQGSILFISSIHGLQGAACEAAYSASKGGLIALGQALAAELGPSGIRVNCLAPGVIMTDMMQGYSQQDLETLGAQTPLSRLGTVEEIAQAAYYLCSQQASYLTGQTLRVDGGISL